VPSRVWLQSWAPSRQKHNNANDLSWWPYQEESTHCHKVEAQADVKQVGAVAAAAVASWDPATPKPDQLNDQDIGPILEEVETGQCPEWKYIAGRSPIYKSYWAQWKSLVVRNGILDPHWEFAGRHSKNRPDNSSLEESEWCPDQTTWWAIRKSLECQQDPE
jgi:hypothetical protein